jgi:hypothetical protein
MGDWLCLGSPRLVRNVARLQTAGSGIYEEVMKAALF